MAPRLGTFFFFFSLANRSLRRRTPDLGDGYYYPDVLAGENILIGQPWPTVFTSDFNIGVFPNLSRSVIAQQASLGLPSTLQQLFPLWGEDNITGGQPWPAALVSDFDISAFPDLNRSVVIQQAPLGLPPAPQQPTPSRSFSCAQVGCTKSFKRDSDRTRHQNTVHSARRGLYLCLIPGCPKSHGRGFSRGDKVTEHL